MCSASNVTKLPLFNSTIRCVKLMTLKPVAQNYNDGCRNHMIEYKYTAKDTSVCLVNEHTTIYKCGVVSRYLLS